MVAVLLTTLRTAGMGLRGYADDFVMIAGSHEDLARQCRYLVGAWLFFIRLR